MTTRPNKSFCVFIISHGRADKIVTIKTLERCGYTGKLFIVCDNEDKSLAQYQEKYGSKMVLVFDKLRYAAMVDSCDNFQNRRTTTHARNACFDFAKELGVDHFLVLDDDYTGFQNIYHAAGSFLRRPIRKIDAIFESVVALLNSDERIDSICFIQGGDLIGGFSSIEKGIFPFKKRKAMNSFFCKTSRRFWFLSRLNEDVNTYLHHGNRGRIFLSLPQIQLDQAQTQATSGGMSDAYLASGTYVKSFYTTMICPSFARVTTPVANTSKTIRRIHHRISWNNAVPKILSDEYRKT
jgi:hypothetical protein